MSETSVRFAKRPDEPELCGTSRLEMFSDGAFAIIITPPGPRKLNQVARRILTRDNCADSRSSHGARFFLGE